ncbi:hypothetical protein [Streptomyces sp. NPDC005303]|uniref:hypothetical protein n=1 Tax=Streptomyces sp. NPDC005303 TaxID=3155713 RepID=UPI0033A5ED0E
MPDIIPSAPQDADSDPFWVKNRADFLATKSRSADPSACGTCRGNVAAGEPVEHDGCAQRATLLQAPDHPDYELLAGFSLEENERLPARFHVPVFDDCGKPNSWLCAVCWEEGQVVGWPCATAIKHGTEVFSPLHQAETAQEKQAVELAAYRALELGDTDGRVSASCGNPEHPTWLRKPDDTHGCAWCCSAELEAENQRLQREIEDAARVSETLLRRLTEEMLAGSALHAALTMPTTPEQRQAALDKFEAVAKQVISTTGGAA